MREIKFRGKRHYDGQWVYGCPLIVDTKKYQSANIVTLDEVYPDTLAKVTTSVDFKTLGQFTGLHDKNGKEIYEGDIIMINLTDGSIAVSSVVWNRRGYWGCDIDINHGVQLGLIDKVRIEVIGNIHDNPELIEKGGEK